MLAIEAAALTRLGESVGAEFAAALTLIRQVEGRVIVSGMGKSGHVARKIAATLASTGTPAQFVHPAEASHGDLGMITERDLALVLSNSGETRELADIIAHTRRFAIPLIGVAARAGSALLRAADVALLLPAAEEASPIVDAPTTSTTLTVALGDALAVALMEGRDFTVERFRAFHPGGSLGAQLVSVADLMASRKRLPLVTPDAPMTEVLIAMTESGFGLAGVIDTQGCLTGIVTDGDLRRHMDGLLARTAGEVATANPLTIAPTRLAQEALALMNAHKITALFVTETPPPAPPLGLVHVHDCLRAGVDGARQG
ncbi:MAG: KpsF/GutQ family sugar-phosphate isomerase [Pseudomonadota bacterium]